MAIRHFCRTCGSLLFGRSDDERDPIMSIYIGTSMTRRCSGRPRRSARGRGRRGTAPWRACVSSMACPFRPQPSSSKTAREPNGSTADARAAEERRMTGAPGVGRAVARVLPGALATALLACSAGTAGGPTVVAGDARFQFLTASLVRMEYSPTGHFIDAPTAVVQKRDWAPLSGAHAAAGRLAGGQHRCAHAALPPQFGAVYRRQPRGELAGRLRPSRTSGIPATTTRRTSAACPTRSTTSAATTCRRAAPSATRRSMT